MVALAGLVIAAILALYIYVEQRYGERPPLIVAVGTITLHALLIEGLTHLDGLTFTSMLYLTLPFPVIFFFGWRTGVCISTGLLVWFTYRFGLAKPEWISDPSALHIYMLFVIAIILIAAMAQLVQRERINRQRAEQLLHDLEISHRELLASHTRVAELATIAERNRLARDIHDSLGHYLTVIGVQLEKAQIVIDEDLTAVRAAVGNAKRLADQALSDVRQSVATLRGDQVPFQLKPALEHLVANLRIVPLRISLCITGDEQLFSTQQKLALYRAVQEGLTNVQRHAQAQQVRIAVDLGEHNAMLTLEDDGIGLQHNQLPGMGFGLRGVRERLELVSGRLVVANAPEGGTRLIVTIPRSRLFEG